MDLDIPERVHIVPVGYEFERIVDSALNYRADKVILIGHEEDGEEEKARLKDLTEVLEAEGVLVETTICDIFDLYSSLGEIGELITEFEDDEVYVNVSTGSKVTAIAGMIACMVMNATAYYAKATNYSDQQPTEIEFIDELPNYPIDPPKREQIVMLFVIQEFEENGVRPAKGRLIHAGEHLGLPFITEKNVQNKGKYRSLDSDILDPMINQEYVTIETEGREKLVHLTEGGHNALRAFRYMIEDRHRQKLSSLLESDRL